jgi:hypothetical protein
MLKHLDLFSGIGGFAIEIMKAIKAVEDIRGVEKT